MTLAHRLCGKLITMGLIGAVVLSAGPASASGNLEFDKSRRDSLTLIEPLSKDEADKARTRLASVRVILQHEKDPMQIFKLRLNRAKVSIQISRVKGVSAAAKSKALELAASDLNAISNIKDLNAEQLSYLNYLRGLVALDSGAYDEGKRFLREAIQNNPKADYAIGLSIYLADEDYFADRFTDAAKEYNRYLDQMTPRDRLRAEYRLAWISAKLGNFREAEKMFLRLGAKQAGQPKGFRKDILRDLAGLEGKFKDEKEIIAFCRDTLKLNADEEIIFLRDAMLATGHEGKGPSGVYLNRISSLTKNAVDKIRLKLQLVQMQNSKNVGGDSEISFESLKSEISVLSKDDRKAVFAQLGHELNAETERAIWRLALKFSALAKSAPQDKGLEPLASMLISNLTFLQNNFLSKNRLKAMKLWLDVCASMRQSSCVLERTNIILSDKEYESLREPALRERISALEELNKSDPAKYIVPLREALEQYLEDPKRADWPAFAKRLSVLDIADKNFMAAQTVLAALDKREKSEESYYRLQLNRFAQGLYAEVVGDNRHQAPFRSKRNADLQNESQLRLAQLDTRPGGNFVSYEAHIKEYLKQVKDPQKRSSLLRDYYNRLEQNHETNKLYMELTQISTAARFAKDLEGLSRRLINSLFSQGQYAKVQALIGSKGSGTPADLTFTGVLARLASGESLPTAEVNHLSQVNKIYVLGLYGLAATSRMEAYIRSVAIAPREIRDIGYLAYKIKSCDSFSPPGPAERRVLGDAIPQEFLTQPVTALESQIEQVTFTKTKKLNKATTAKMMKSLERVRDIRQLISADLPKEPVAVQLRVLTKGASLESRAAEAVTGAPLPDGLNQTQAGEYQGQVREMAKEFSMQAEQFQHAFDKLNKTIASKAAKILPVKKLRGVSAWPWPASESLRNLRDRDDSDSVPLMTALIDLDFLRSTVKIADVDYWMMRSGLLLSKAPCDSMVDYVYQELMANGQNKIIQQWSRL